MADLERASYYAGLPCNICRRHIDIGTMWSRCQDNGQDCRKKESNLCGVMKLKKIPADKEKRNGLWYEGNGRIGVPSEDQAC